MSERTYRCLQCFDGGIVSIFNPAFVQEYSEVFAEGVAVDGLYARIHGWWRLHQRWPKLGAVHHSALCDCGCRQREVLSAELGKFRRGERKGKGRDDTPPGCSNAIWTKDLSPLWPGAIDDFIYRALDDFYNGRLF